MCTVLGTAYLQVRWGGLPVALREFQEYLVTTILNLNGCEAISIFSLFSNVAHCSGTVLILLPVVNAECTYDLH